MKTKRKIWKQIVDFSIPFMFYLNSLFYKEIPKLIQQRIKKIDIVKGERKLKQQHSTFIFI